MSSGSPGLRPRGPLPARVYWLRRIVVLTLALVLVVGVSTLLGRFGDGADRGTADDPAAQPAGGSPTTADPAEGDASSAATQGPTVADPTDTAGEDGQGDNGQGENGQGKNGKKDRPDQTPTTPEPPPLPEPEGPCATDDVQVAPAAGQVIGGTAIGLTVNLRSVETAACTWSVSPETLTATITSGSDYIWSSRECPAAVPVQDLVLYQQQDTPVVLTWSGRRSDEDCSKTTQWALPGFYHVEVAALGGEPADLQFEVVAPPPPVVTKTAEPKKKNKRN